MKSQHAHGRTHFDETIYGRHLVNRDSQRTWLARLAAQLLDWCRASNHGLPPARSVTDETDAFTRSRGL